MNVIEIKTLIDITNTGVNRPKAGLQLEYDQHRNFVTLKQCVELRSNIQYDTQPSVETKDIKDMGFGSNYKGKHAVWTFRFNPERSGVYVKDNDEIGCLYDDLHEIPVVKNLKESINIEQAIFDLRDPKFKNTVIKVIKDSI